MKKQNLTLEQISTPHKENNEQSGFEIKKDSNFLRAFGRSYPNLKFACPSCGMFDVILDLKNSDSIAARCMECQNRWMEDYEY